MCGQAGIRQTIAAFDLLLVHAPLNLVDEGEGGRKSSILLGKNTFGLVSYFEIDKFTRA